MAQFFKPNIDRRGRFARAIYGAVCIVGGGFALDWKLWVAVLLFIAGLFGIFEALRGWCVMRACGVKTRM
jgi:hypothetical protein